MSNREQLVVGQEYISVPDCEGILAAIKRFGYESFSGYDGCMCGHFSLRAIGFSISCRKSSGGHRNDKFYGTTVRITCNHLGSGEFRRLIPLAMEMVKQVQESEGHLPVCVRFVDWKCDSDGACAYCGATPRADSYFCAKHVSRGMLPDVWTGIFPAVKDLS